MDAIHMNVEGIIFTMIPNDPGFVEKVAKQFPIVVIGDKTSSINIDIIETNNYTAGVLVAEHLHSLGHRHIAFLTTTITPDVSLAMRYQRLKAIQNTYAKLCANEPYDVIVREQRLILNMNEIICHWNTMWDISCVWTAWKTGACPVSLLLSGITIWLPMVSWMRF